MRAHRLVAATLLAACGDHGPSIALEDLYAETVRARCDRFARCGFLEGAPTAPPSESAAALRGVQVAVTALGRQALAGAVDRVHEAGIDDWRGGVRLLGRGPVWRWDGQQRKLIER